MVAWAVCTCFPGPQRRGNHAFICLKACQLHSFLVIASWDPSYTHFRPFGSFPGFLDPFYTHLWISTSPPRISGFFLHKHFFAMITMNSVQSQSVASVYSPSRHLGPWLWPHPDPVGPHTRPSLIDRGCLGALREPLGGWVPPED